MPLLANEKRLDDFLQEYLGKVLESLDAHAVAAVKREMGITDPGKKGITIEPWGRYVYLVATSYEAMSSKANDIGLWAERDLVFHVPAKVKVGDKLWKIVLVPVYAFANSTTAALSAAEITGIPVAYAKLESPTDGWMEPAGPGTEATRSLLLASATVLPASGQGQKVDVRPLLEVFEGSPVPRGDAEKSRSIAENWGWELKKDLHAKQSEFVCPPESPETNPVNIARQ